MSRSASESSFSDESPTQQVRRRRLAVPKQTMAEERARIDAAMTLLDGAKAKARAQRQEYGEYLRWKVSMQRAERRQREEEEYKLRGRVEDKLKRVLKEHKEKKRSELTVYRQFANDTVSVLHSQLLLPTGDGSEDDGDNGGVADDSAHVVRPRRKRSLLIADSFANEDAHFESYLMERERKRREWDETKRVLAANFIGTKKAVPQKDVAHASQSRARTEKKHAKRTKKGYAPVDPNTRSAGMITANVRRLNEIKSADPSSDAEEDADEDHKAESASEGEGPTIQGYRQLMAPLAHGSGGGLVVAAETVDDETDIMRPNHLSAQNLASLNLTELKRHHTQKRSECLADMAAKARCRRLYATQRLAADPTADVLVGDTVRTYFPIQEQLQQAPEMALELADVPSNNWFLTQQAESETAKSVPEPKGTVQQPLESRVVQVREIPRNTKTRWYKPYNPYGWMGVALDTRVLEPVPNSVAEILAETRALAREAMPATDTAPVPSPPRLAAVPQHVSPKAARVQPPAVRPPLGVSAGLTMSGKPFNVRNTKEEAAWLEWHEVRQRQISGTHRGEAEDAPLPTSSRDHTLGSRLHTIGFDKAPARKPASAPQPVKWTHRSKPFLPPIRSIFVDPDISTAAKFIKMDQERRSM